MKARAIFISDTHFGCKISNSNNLYEFLKTIENTPEYIYLVGDIIDGWKLSRQWHWKDEYNFIIRKIFSFSKKGSKIIWIAGNHDEFLRGFVENFGSIEVSNEHIHETLNNKKLLIIHGDKFDSLLKCGNFLKFIGDVGYDKLIYINSLITKFKNFFGIKNKWSLSQTVKTNFKSISCYVSQFEQMILEYAKKKGCSGVVCGHIHVPKISKIDGMDYYNCGDWQENSTAIIEDLKGNFKLVNYDE